MRHKGLRLLLAGPLLVAGNSLAAAQDSGIEEAAWAEATSPPLGLSFHYPAGWTVDVPDFEPALGRYGYTITVTPAAADATLRSKIEMVYQDCEIPSDQDLSGWVDDLLRTSPFFRTPPDVEIIAQAAGSDAPRSDLLHVRMTHPGVQTEAIWLTHGRLVYALVAYDPSDQMSDVLARMAESTRFAPDAPTSLDTLYGTSRTWPSLKEAESAAEALWLQADPASSCDLACRDAKAARGIVPGDRHPGGVEFDEQETLYNAWLESLGPDPGGQAGAMPEGQVLSTRKALPANWWSPVQVTGTATKNADCSSSWHGGDSAMAVDIQGVGTSTSVYAAQSGTVSATGWNAGGYGNYVVVSTSAAVADESRTYQHLYAQWAGSSPQCQCFPSGGVPGRGLQRPRGPLSPIWVQLLVVERFSVRWRRVGWLHLDGNALPEG